MSTTEQPTIRAAGCVIWRYGSTEPEVLLVHRPRWDDITFPKGKLNRFEPAPVAAVREVREETSLRVSLGARLRDDHYLLQSGQPKAVSYWVGHPPRLADISRREPTEEIDEVRWLSVSKARKRLSYPRDVDLLDEFLSSSFDTSVLLVVRHAEARKRKTWRGDDSERPLTAVGARVAEQLAPVIDAYGITRVVTSDSTRCVETVLPYVNGYDVKMRLDHGLSEQGVSDKALARTARRSLDSHKRMLLCTHRPVLPRLFRALGIDDIQLEPAQMVIVHRRHGQIQAVEKPS
jgi:8-oxo-dGTP pyrophosphatase MutT (NUDIX family)/phosphohistidine phosphatase SixA